MVNKNESLNIYYDAENDIYIMKVILLDVRKFDCVDDSNFDVADVVIKRNCFMTVKDLFIGTNYKVLTKNFKLL